MRACTQRSAFIILDHGRRSRPVKRYTLDVASESVTRRDGEWRVRDPASRRANSLRCARARARVHGCARVEKKARLKRLGMPLSIQLVGR